MKRKKKTKWTELTQRERLIAISYAKGLRGMECATDAGLSYANQVSATTAVNKVMAHPAAKAYVKRINDQAVANAEEGAILSVREKLEFCARVVRCKPNKEPDDSDLWQEFRTTSTETSETVIRKLPDKRLTIELDNKLQGHGQPDPDDESTTDVLARIIADIATTPRTKETM